MQKIEIENYKNHGIWISDNEYSIFWFRGKKHFSYEATEELVEKSRKSDKDALEVMFYLEHGRWPKEGELENYNKTEVKTYVGDGFLIYEENGKYEIEIERDWGKAERYPINKELKEKALKYSRDGYEVAIYSETGRWPLKDQDEVDRNSSRQHPELKQELFSKEEYAHLVKLAKEEQEKEKTAEREKEEIRGNPELISWVSEKKRNMFSKEEIERLEVQANEIIKTRKEKLRKRWGKIIAVSIVVLISLRGGLDGYYKVNNKNAFEEMYNSCYSNYSKFSIRSVEHMPKVLYSSKIEPSVFQPGTEYTTTLRYTDFKTSMVLKKNERTIKIEKETKISMGVYLIITYEYDMNTRKLTNHAHINEATNTDYEKRKSLKELLEKYHITKEQLQEESDELLDTILTDWKNFSSSPYSKDNMGELTIEKDEILR